MQQKIIFFITLLLANFGFAQTENSEDYYLISSSTILMATDYDKSIIDSCLKIFHQVESESEKLKAVNGIIEETAGLNIWTSYNDWLYDYTNTELKKDNRPEREKLLLRNKAGAVNNFGYYFQLFGDLDSAIVEYNKSLKIYEQIGDQIGTGNTLNNMGSIHYLQGNIALALSLYEKSLASRIIIGDQRGIANSLNNIGLIFQEEGDVSNALTFYERSLLIRENIGDPDLISTQVNNIGLCYLILGDNIEAENYFKRSLKIDEERNYQTGIAYSLFNIGRSFQNEEFHGKALEKYEESYDIFTSERNGIESGNCLGAIGQVYAEKGQNLIAIDYFNQALEIHEKSEFNDGICQSLEGLSGCYLSLGKIDLAISSAQKSLAIAKELGYLNRIKNATFRLYEIYSATGNDKDALEHYLLYKEVSDSIVIESTKKNFDLNKAALIYDQRLAYQKKQSEENIKFLQQKDAEQQTTITLITVSLIIILILLFIIMIRLRKHSIQKKQIEKQHREKEILLKEIHHRVKNSLQITTSIIRLQKMSLSNKDAIEALENSEGRIGAIALVHKLLYQDTEIKSISLGSYLSELAINFSLDKNGFDINIDCPQMKVETDIATPIAIICSELISNSVKHSGIFDNEKTLINIKVLQIDENKACLTISDSGKGFQDNFELSQSEGLGFEIIQALCEQIDANFQMLRPEKGAAFKITFPNATSA